jgi:HD superfamily phosphohydrolase
MKIVKRHLGQVNNFEDNLASVALAAALVHDVGHGPFSHAFEEVGKIRDWKLVKKHELVSDALIRNSEISEKLKLWGSGFANDVADLVSSEKPKSIYAAVVSSQFDADRLDYMRRDRMMTGTQHAAIDFEWLLANLEVGVVQTGVDETHTGEVETFVLGPKAVYAAEAYVLGLFQLYPTVYFHKTTRCFEKLFSQLLLRLSKMVTDGSGNNTGLDTRHPLFAFCQEPDSLDRILALDDTCVSGAYAMMCDCPDSILSSLAQRLRDRKRLKCIDVRRDIEQSLSWESISNEQQAIEKACKSIKSKVENWLSEKKSDFPSILTDEGIRVPYKEYDESKGPLNQIRIRVSEKLDAEHIDLRDRSKVVMAIEPFKFNRLYVENDESEKFVHGLIKEEIAYVKKGKSD